VTLKERRETSQSAVKCKVQHEKVCVRCGSGFLVTDSGEYLTHEKCIYHWGKLWNVRKPGTNTRNEYTCCQGEPGSRGCTTCKLHVWNNTVLMFNGPFNDYVRTCPCKTPLPDENFGVYALDCEMCYTTRGFELLRVSVVAEDGSLTYDTLVRPEGFVIDYCTRFSELLPVISENVRQKPYGMFKTIYWVLFMPKLSLLVTAWTVTSAIYTLYIVL
jgi:RNA exonuclease 1